MLTSGLYESEEVTLAPPQYEYKNIQILCRIVGVHGAKQSGYQFFGILISSKEEMQEQNLECHIRIGKGSHDNVL